MWRPTNGQWWTLLITSLLIFFAWPPADGKSLALKITNWAVDPRGELPLAPGPIPFGLGDDMDAVNAHDMQAQAYDEMYARGGWSRLRLELKEAGEPFDPSTERQVLAGVGIVVGFLVWRSSAVRT